LEVAHTEAENNKKELTTTKVGFRFGRLPERLKGNACVKNPTTATQLRYKIATLPYIVLFCNTIQQQLWGFK